MMDAVFRGALPVAYELQGEVPCCGLRERQPDCSFRDTDVDANTISSKQSCGESTIYVTLEIGQDILYI